MCVSALPCFSSHGRSSFWCQIDAQEFKSAMTGSTPGQSGTNGPLVIAQNRSFEVAALTPPKDDVTYGVENLSGVKFATHPVLMDILWPVMLSLTESRRASAPENVY